MPRPEPTPFDLWLNETRQDIFDYMETVDWSCNRMAKYAGLAPGTVYNLRKKKTREPRASTIFKLARSLGLSLEVSEKHRQQASSRSRKSS